MCEGNCENWIPTNMDFASYDWQGKPISLQVQAEVCPACGLTRIDSDILSIAEQKKIAEILDLTPEEMSILWFLYAPGPRFTKKGYIEQKYRFNKMLFYFWRKLVENGFGKALIHDVFESKNRGPVPVNLIKHSKSLESKGLVKMQWGGKQTKKPYRWELTKKGEKVAEELWNKTPNIFKKKVIEVKWGLFLLDTTELMDKVHAEYPEYRSSYKQEDKE